ncbi:MAG: Glu/Leu/Phe/Val dehydrogenase dimerization domain-containing protein [Vampirovibrionales bacterium]|nr:Glu/Leu/Phe/Val dehydrogenase dimerization domain-containing protein [Vampirovibrionales bacterium]
MSTAQHTGNLLADGGLFHQFHKRNHEAVVFCSEREVGLRAIIALHDTTLGPSLGGCRIKQYTCEQEALTDVLRLSRAMTYKASAGGLNLGGGKSVILLEPGQEKTPELLTAFAKRVAMLKGTYITAGDVGSTTQDLKLMSQFCRHVVGLAEEDGGLGDSSILTSLGVFRGLQAAVKTRLGKDDLTGLSVAVQGAGKVGLHLVEYLLNAGCSVVLADPNADAVAAAQLQFPAITTCATDDIYDQDVDVFSPNAIGGLLTESIARRMKAVVVAGGANNPLASDVAAMVLNDRNILYAPDFVINAGGLIMVASEIEHQSFEQAKARVEEIYDRTLHVFEYAKSHSLLPWEAARQIAVNRIVQYRNLTKSLDSQQLADQCHSVFESDCQSQQLQHSRL